MTVGWFCVRDAGIWRNELTSVVLAPTTLERTCDGDNAETATSREVASGASRSWLRHRDEVTSNRSDPQSTMQICEPVIFTRTPTTQRARSR